MASFKLAARLHLLVIHPAPRDLCPVPVQEVVCVLCIEVESLGASIFHPTHPRS